jgi:hypothetical protein
MRQLTYAQAIKDVNVASSDEIGPKGFVEWRE